MKIRVMSDLHLEFDRRDFFPIKNTGDDRVLVLAGDIAPWMTDKDQYIRTIATYYTVFKAIIIVAGNHEFYAQGDIPEVLEDMRKEFSRYPNVHVLENEWVIIDDVVFIGSTMWTDLDERNPASVWHVLSSMHDFSQITVNGQRLNPDLFWEMNRDAKTFLRLATDTFDGHKMVVVTHHLPSRDSIPVKYREHKNMWGYVCEMDNLILNAKPKLWVHGHTHDSADYMIGDTRVVCNPRGYWDIGEVNPTFDPRFEVEV